MIEVVDFCKSYNTHSDFSVKNVNLTINKGEIVGLLGSNGSGKSTIMKAICGFHFPTSGNIYINDKTNDKINISENPQKAMENTGFVPETTMLPLEMNVYDFFIYISYVHGLSKEQTELKIKELVKLFNLQDLLSKKIKTLSKGQQQRVSFAQSLIHAPDNLILDEPVTGLDPAQIKQMRQIIKELSKTKAILFSTHILQEAHSLCSSIYIMKNGVLHNTKKNLSLEQLEEEFIRVSESDEK